MQQARKDLLRKDEKISCEVCVNKMREIMFFLQKLNVKFEYKIHSYAGRILALILMCLILSFFGGCARNTEFKTLPSTTLEQAQNMVFSHYLDKGATIEAFDAQAIPALKAGLAKYWYPLFQATVVIAVDRDRTDAKVNSWSDLRSIHEKVGFNNAHIHGELMMAAMAYGLEGDGFTLNQAAYLWSLLQAENRLERNPFEAPVVVCYDYQAAAQIKNGRNLEVIVPLEGTLTYEKGLLSNTEFAFMADIDLLLSEGFRLMDGRCDNVLYPDAAAYKNAAKIMDYEHIDAILKEAAIVLRRDVLYTRLVTSADEPGYQFFVLIYCIIVVVWTASVMQRAMQKGVRRAALLSGILLLGWITARLINYQLSIASDLSRYLWYSYYLFQLMLPIALVWMAWVSDKPDDIRLPKWLLTLAVINVALIAMVMKNDLHNLVFRLDLSNPNWSSAYDYGVGFYFVMAGCFTPVAAGIVIMLVKAWQNPRRKGFVFPLSFVALLTLYTAGYIARVPVVWESDAVMVTGLFALLFFEAAIQTGMIPVNSKYASLFTHSPLSMQIIDKYGNAALISEHALHDKDMYASAINQQSLWQYDENTLLFSDNITGGRVLWKEDITSLNCLHKQIEESVRKIQAANTLLVEEEKVKRAVEEENARKQLLEQLEAEITRNTDKLSTMLEQLKPDASQHREAGRIALLLCYIKRRCNLFFRERETFDLPHEELTAYIDELAGIAGYSDVRIIASSDLSSQLSSRHTTVFYDFFYSVADWASSNNCTHLLAHMGQENKNITMRILLSEDARSFQMEKDLYAAIASEGGAYSVKDLDDAFGISLSFPGGED